MPLRLFCWHPPPWWGRVQGCGCGWSCRTGPSRSIYRSASNAPYIYLRFWCCVDIFRIQTYEQPQERPASRLSQRSSPTPTNQLGQLQATSHPPTSHIRCVPSAYPFHLQQRQCELRETPAAAFTARHLLPACLPNHCWLCEAGRYRPVSSSSLLLPVLTYHIIPYRSLATAIHRDAGCTDEETQA